MVYRNFLQYRNFSVVPIVYSIVAGPGISNEVNIVHVKLTGMFKYNPGIYTYCGCVINFIGQYMPVFTSFMVLII